MALIPTPILDFTDKDFASLRLRLQGLARSVFPTWTDFNTPNFGNLLLEMFAHIGDTVGFYQDAQAREAFWPTVTRRISAIRLGRQINFQLPGAFPSSGDARLVLATAHTKDIPVLVGTRFRTNDQLNPLPFRSTNTEVLTLLAGALSLDVPVEQVEFIASETFESSGAPNQEFIVDRRPYLDASAIIVAANGTYTEIDSFLNVTEADPRRFVVLVDENDRAHFFFGNGQQGQIPEGTTQISYKITRGEVGNLEPGQLENFIDTIVDIDGDDVAGLTVTNVANTTGGADRMTIAQARTLAPATLRALSRSVTRSDFETHAQEVSGVSRVTLLTSNEDVAVAENNGILMVVARGQRLDSGKFEPATPTQTLLDAVLNQVTVVKPSPVTFTTTALAAPFKEIDASTKVHFVNGAVKADTAQDIVDSLQDFFAATEANGTPNTKIDFGANILDDQGIPVAEIAWSDVFNAIRDTPGIRKMDEGDDNLLLNNKQQSVLIGLREFPRIRKITIIDAADNTTILTVDVTT